MKENYNVHSAFVQIGASNHCDENRAELDFYSTEPKAVRLLLEQEHFSKNVWECACGEGHIADVLKENGYNVVCSDIVNRGYSGTKEIDFLKWGGRTVLTLLRILRIA